MITITIYGADPFAVGEYSADVTAQLTNLLEDEDEEIFFIAPDNLLYYRGVEQSSLHGLIVIEAPERYRPLEAKVARFLFDTASRLLIHIHLQFRYFHDDYHHQIHDDYPRYITAENEVLINEDEQDEETEIYEGDVFEGFDEKWQATHVHHHHDDDDHGHDHD